MTLLHMMLTHLSLYSSEDFFDFVVTDHYIFLLLKLSICKSSSTCLQQYVLNMSLLEYMLEIFHTIMNLCLKSVNDILRNFQLTFSYLHGDVFLKNYFLINHSVIHNLSSQNIQTNTSNCLKDSSLICNSYFLDSPSSTFIFTRSLQARWLRKMDEATLMWSHH
jgi:hypothetical protein